MPCTRSSDKCVTVCKIHTYEAYITLYVRTPINMRVYPALINDDNTSHSIPSH